MSVKLEQLIKNEYGNYILPFLWLHGEEEDYLRKEVRKIYECGIRAFCAESRPHPDFLGPRWWSDMDILIDEAKKLDMKIWILDDAHFPTGTAAGAAATCALENRKSVLGHRWIDVTGPLCGTSFIPPYEVSIPDIRYVIAARLDKIGEYINITDKFINNRLYFDVPDGIWRIYYFYINPDCIHSPHINHLRKGGAKILLDAVYIPHFEHYANEFGKTIAGFFSDEPGFFACEKGFDSYERTIGDEHISIPWDNDMEMWLTNESSLPIEKILPVLVDTVSSTKHRCAYLRYTYMNIVTQKYDECFCQTIGDWCRSHGVEYMGHITEDNNSHNRIGLSAGHFYRGMYGQDYSGADVVLHQILPGMEDINHAAFTGFYANSLSDGEFYSYALYQMATSLSQIDARKKGRTMCELFGAYGWGEGCKMMKWMSDFMLIRGINHFVPHAFSPKAFPDDDCPPHFYSHNANPQFEGFKKLMPYVNRVAHLLNGGCHDAQIAVLYHGDFEWTGGNVMYSQIPGKALMNSHLQYDIIPADALFKGELSDGKLILNTQQYRIIIVPYTEYISDNHHKALEDIANAGVKVVFIDSLPKYLFKKDICTEFAPSDYKYQVLKVDELADFCHRFNQSPIIVLDGENSPLLRTYVYKYRDCTIYMLANSHPTKTILTQISLTASGNAIEYDAYNNKIYTCQKQFSLTLPAYESRIYIVGDVTATEVKPIYKNSLKLENINWRVSICTQKEYPNFKFYQNTDTLINYNHPELLPEFSGIIRYEAEIDIPADIINAAIMFTDVSESIQLWINEEDVGICIAPPYQISLNKKLHAGKNTIRIEIRNTLYNSIPDIFSRYLPIMPTGLTGDIIVLY